MNRARRPTPFEMKDIFPDPRTGRFIISESGITYHLSLEHTRLLKDYYRWNMYGIRSLEKWFNDLDRDTRKEVIRTGVEQQMDPYFYPDPSFD